MHYPKILAVCAFLFSSLAACGPSKDTGAAILEQGARNVVTLTPPSNSKTGGTGFLVQAPHSGKTYILTNGHICEHAENGYLSARKEAWATGVSVRVIAVSDDTDLCLVDALPGETGGYQLGEDVTTYEELYVVGHPLLNPLTLTSGRIVSRAPIELSEPNLTAENCTGKSRQMKSVESYFGTITICIRTVDAWDSSITIYPGNSGSPLLNSRGELMGVMFAADQRTNRGLAVPIDAVRGFLGFY